MSSTLLSFVVYALLVCTQMPELVAVYIAPQILSSQVQGRHLVLLARVGPTHALVRELAVLWDIF